MRLPTSGLAAVVAAAGLLTASPASADHCERHPKPVDVVCQNAIPERCYWTEHGIVCEY